MSQPRSFLLPGENETMHNIMQEHYRKTGQVDKLDPLADPINVDFEAAPGEGEPNIGLGFMEMYPIHAVAVYMIASGEQGEARGVQKGWELLEAWLTPTAPIAELPPRPSPEPEPEPDEDAEPSYLMNKKRPVYTVWDIGTVKEGKVHYECDDVDKLTPMFRHAASLGGVLTLRFRPEAKAQNKFCSYADVGDPSSKKAPTVPDAAPALSQADLERE